VKLNQSLIKLREFRERFNGHVRRVDASTKLTQHQPNSQFKQAKAALALIDAAIKQVEDLKGNEYIARWGEYVEATL